MPIHVRYVPKTRSMSVYCWKRCKWGLHTAVKEVGIASTLGATYLRSRGSDLRRKPEANAKNQYG
jgi:hypothetical protein